MHTTQLDVPGKTVWMLHNGDFSGETLIRWSAEGGDDGVHEVILPDGVLKAIVTSLVASKLPAAVENFLDSGHGRDLLKKLLFR